MFFCDVNIPSNLGYVCYRYFWENGYISRPHWHGFIELEFFIEGTGIHNCNNATFQIKNGDAWVLSTDDKHQLTLDKGMKSINLAVAPDMLHEKLLAHLSSFHPLHCTFSPEETHAFLQKMELLFDEQEDPKILSRVKAAAIINEMFVDIARKSSDTLQPINNTLVNNMINYMQSHFQENLSLTELAQMFSFTPNYCGHLFKKITGITFKDYLNNLRVKYACKLLLDSNYSIQEIAYDSGFNSVEYFYTTFKNFYGVTPAKYRTMAPKDFIGSDRSELPKGMGV